MADSKAKGRKAVPKRQARESVAHFEQIIESLTSGVIAVDKTGEVLVANSAASQHLEVPHKELAKGRLLLDSAVPAPFLERIRFVLEAQEPLTRQEIILTQPDGEKREIGLSASLLKTRGRFGGAVFLFVDMTERRTLERAAELNRQLAQIGELTAGVVHELRNPLSVISGMAELLQRRIEPDDPRRRNTDTIVSEARRMGQSIAQFLGFARPFDLEPEHCRPEDIAGRVEQLCQNAAKRKNVTLTFQHRPPLPVMRADPGKLSQALANIVANAIDAVDGGGHVTMATSREEADIVFEITDNGPGIHIQPGEDLFKPFFTKKESGTGLGLAICHRIVSAHAGTVGYGNCDEGGARFVVRVPIEKGAPR